MIDRQILETVVAAQRRPGYFEHALPAGMDFQEQHYRIEATLYRGQSGFVYEGLHRLTGKRVAIKEFFPQVTIVEGDVTLTLQRRTGTPYVAIAHFSERHFDIFEQVKARFINEARTLQHLKQKRWTVPLLDVFEANGTVYLVLEYMEAPTLAECMAFLQGLQMQKGQQVSSWLDAQCFDAIASSLAQNIEALHHERLLHRDLKPANLFVTSEGVVLGDFGIARQGAEEGLEGTLVYSVQYAAPEQMHPGGRQGTWTDWYAYGRILERLAGLLPEAEIEKALYARPELLAALTTYEVEQRICRYADIEVLLRRKAHVAKPKRGGSIFIATAAAVLVLCACVMALLLSRPEQRGVSAQESIAPTAILGAGVASPETASVTSATTESTQEETQEETQEDTLESSKTTEGQKASNAAVSQSPLQTAVQTEALEKLKALTEAQTEVQTEVQIDDQIEKQTETKANAAAPQEPETFGLTNAQWQVAVQPERDGKFSYGEPMLVKWQAHEKLAPYGISLSITDLTTWMSVARRVPVTQGTVDLSTLGLKPGKYRLYFSINCPPVTQRPFTTKDITVVSASKPLGMPQLVAFPKSFELGSDAIMSWSRQQGANGYRLTITRLSPSQVLLGKYVLTDQQLSLKLSDYIKSPGTYSISLAGEDGQGLGLMATRTVQAYAATTLPPPELNLSHHQYFTHGSGRVISWQPVKKAVRYQLSLYHYGYSETIFEGQDLGLATRYDFSGLPLKAGSYLVVLSYVDDSGKKSLQDEAIIEVEGQ